MKSKTGDGKLKSKYLLVDKLKTVENVIEKCYLFIPQQWPKFSYSVYNNQVLLILFISSFHFFFIIENAFVYVF